MDLETSDKKLFRMAQYVEQEGHEKAEEIEAKTEDEFNTEKKILIKEACAKIDEEFYKMRCQCRKRDKLELLTLTSTSRKDLIRVKQKAIDIILGQIKEIIAIDMKCPTGRWAILKLLIMEGLYKLLESFVVIRCRKQDAVIIAKYITDLENEYFEKSKQKVKIIMGKVPIADDPLPAVALLVKNGRIILNNSLRDRVDQIFEYFIPVISCIFYETKKLDTRSFTFVNFF